MLHSILSRVNAEGMPGCSAIYWVDLGIIKLPVTCKKGDWCAFGCFAPCFQGTSILLNLLGTVFVGRWKLRFPSFLVVQEQILYCLKSPFVNQLLPFACIKCSFLLGLKFHYTSPMAPSPGYYSFFTVYILGKGSTLAYDSSIPFVKNICCLAY